jgi:hypothetical protein
MLGRLIGVPYFLTEESYLQDAEDKSDIRRARSLRLDDDGRSLRTVQVSAVRRMQAHFFGSILRRTTTSLDWEGKVLIDIPPYVDLIGVLDLTKREMDILQERQEAAKARLVNLRCRLVLTSSSLKRFFSVTSANETGKFQTRVRIIFFPCSSYMISKLSVVFKEILSRVPQRCCVCARGSGPNATQVPHSEGLGASEVHEDGCMRKDLPVLPL